MTSPAHMPQNGAILSVHFQKDRLGICIYRPACLALEVCECWDHGPLAPPSLSDLCKSTDSNLSVVSDSYPALRSLLRQVRPVLVLAPARSEDSLLALLHDYIKERSTSANSQCSLQLLKPSFYSLEQCYAFVLALPLPELEHSQDRRVGMASLISFDDVSMLRATGAFLAFLVTEVVGDTADFHHGTVVRDPLSSSVRLTSQVAPISDLDQLSQKIAKSAVRVTTLTRFELDGRLHLDTSVFDYLQIFHADPHPSALSGAPKEGVSLYNLLNRCHSKIGSKLLKNWLLAPLSDPHLISARLDAINFLTTWIDKELSKRLEFHLRHVGDLRVTFSRLQIGTATSSDWLQLKTTCTHALNIVELVRTLVTENHFDPSTAPHSIFSRLYFSEDDSLISVTQILADGLEIDPKKDKKPIVRGNVDEELDRLRSVQADLDGFLDRVAKRELSRYKEIESLRVIYVPQMGFQLGVPFREETQQQVKDHVARITTLIDGEKSSSCQFVSNHYMYWKTKTMHELDSFLGDIQPSILDRVDLVLRDIASNILQYTRQLINFTQLVGELDVLLALTKVAKENHFVRPKILNPIHAFVPTIPEHVSHGAINIVGGRHPLLEYVLSNQATTQGSLVSNSTHISLRSDFASDHPSLHILLGPNGSGKSVYMTQIGLIVFMAHIGSFVPAESAEISCVDQIFCFHGGSAYATSGVGTNGIIGSGPNAFQSRIGLDRDALEASPHTTSSDPTDAKTSFSTSTSSSKLIATSTMLGSGSGSFLSDVHRMGRILRNATPLSLVIIDEFGRGTTEIDASSLLLASIDLLCTPRNLMTENEAGQEITSEGTPKVIIATHLKEILHSEFLHRKHSQQVQYFHMNVLPPDADDHQSGAKASRSQRSPTYLYQVTPVTPDYIPLQLGIHTALMAGVPPSILKRASEIKSLIFHNRPIAPIHITQDQQPSKDRDFERILAALEYNFGADSVNRMDTLDATSFMTSIWP